MALGYDLFLHIYLILLYHIWRKIYGVYSSHSSLRRFDSCILRTLRFDSATRLPTSVVFILASKALLNFDKFCDSRLYCSKLDNNDSCDIGSTLCAGPMCARFK